MTLLWGSGYVNVADFKWRKIIMSQAKSKQNTVQSFEAAVQELTQLVTQMESGQLSLEASLAAYQRGSELLSHCQKILTDAEQKVQVLEANQLKPFNSAAQSQ